MADSVTSRLLSNGASNLIANFTNLSDGTGESAVVKIDATDAATYGYKGVAPGVNLNIRRIEFSVHNGSVNLLWDATTDEIFAVLQGQGKFNWKPGGGRRTPSIGGATGSILLTTNGFMINSGYTITIFATKGVPQT